ncbi:ABC transporter substrate-binding protein [Halobacteriaceae archaeon GCM10025711]
MRTSPASITGLDEDEAVTEALVWNNPDPVGSGPLRFEAAEQEESLTFARFEDHFLTRDDLPTALTPFAGGFGFDRLRFVVVPSAAAALELIEAGDADATASHVSPSLVPDIGRASNLDLHVSRPSTFYHLGFNVRKSPLSNPRFRRALVRLLDREHLVTEVFEGYADPALTPLAQYPSRASDLAWNGESPELAFPGEDGVLDVDEAKTAFRDAGYRYNDEGNLLVQ